MLFRKQGQVECDVVEDLTLKCGVCFKPIKKGERVRVQKVWWRNDDDYIAAQHTKHFDKEEKK